MKKALSVLIVIIALISLCACSRQDLEDMTYGEGDGYARQMVIRSGAICLYRRCKYS